MSQHIAVDDAPIYTSTRVPPAADVGRASRLGGEESVSDDDPIGTTRIPPTVTRFG